MISLNKEQKIRKLITNGIVNHEIAGVVGVTAETVENIRVACSITACVPKKVRDEVRLLLLGGLPVGAIGMRLRVPKPTILAIRRFFYLQNRTASGVKALRCPTCSAIMYPADCKPRRIPRSIEINAGEGINCTLFRLVTDILELDNLQLITNPLFHSLANRAEEVINKIQRGLHAKKSSKEA